MIEWALRKKSPEFPFQTLLKFHGRWFLYSDIFLLLPKGFKIALSHMEQSENKSTQTFKLQRRGGYEPYPAMYRPVISSRQCVI